MVLDKATTRYVSLMMTHACNLNCIYCYEHFKDSGRMDVNKAKGIIEKAFASTITSGLYKALELSFMGGEPLLEFDAIKEISEWMWSREWPLKFILFASTNGTLLTEEMKSWFEANKNRIVLGISLDGQPLSQSGNRGRAAAEIDIDFFVKTWPLQGIKTTVSKESLRSLTDDVAFIHAKGFRTIYANLAFGIDWGREDLDAYKQELLRLVDFYMDHPDLERCSLLNLDLFTLLDTSEDYGKYCGCGEGTILIDIDGKVYPCPVFSPITLPKYLLEGLNKIDFSNPKLFMDSKCGKCLFKRTCPKCYGINFLLTGDPGKVSSFGCSAFRIQVLANCILQQRMLEKGLIAENDRVPLQKVLQLILALFNQ